MSSPMFEFYGRTSAASDVCRWIVPFTHILAIQVHLDTAEDVVHLVNGTVIYIDTVGLDDSVKDHVESNMHTVEAYFEYQE